ncbi:MAG: stage III sporulation protein AB [Acetobacteraceae bacterium]|nr:stage III sporulation protein AB [Acetobacteraceae bacterium]
MWFKMMGAALVLVASAWFGQMVASNYAARPREIAALAAGLQFLETEIVYGSTPLPAALGRVGREVEGPAGAPFRRAAELLEGGGAPSAAEAWRQALEECWKETAMDRADLEAVAALGPTLGASDRADQSRHLRSAVERLKRREQVASDERARNEGMWRYLGILGGAAVVLLLI